MKNVLDCIPRKLNASNIKTAIATYRELLKNVPVSVGADNILSLLKKIKREQVMGGPYPNVTLFEAANRIMTDLTILYGVRDLLNGKMEGIRFDEYIVELGNESKNSHDIQAENDEIKLIGEAFNVAESFFQGKKNLMLKKLRESRKANEIILLVYNDDAVKESYRPKQFDREYHLPVKIDLLD